MPRAGTYALACLKVLPEFLPSVAGRLVKGPTRRWLAARLQLQLRVPSAALPKLVAAMKTTHAPRMAVPGGRHSLPPPGRRRARLVVVVHLAYKAGPHAEMYIVDPKTGIAHNVGVVRLDQDDVHLNSDGWLTVSSKERVRDVFRRKATGRDWMAFSTDHRPDEARAEWNHPDDGPAVGEYGAGPLRQVIWEEDV